VVNPQHLRRLGGELPVGIGRQVQPGGDTATRELVEPGGAELAAGAGLDPLVVPHARCRGRALHRPAGDAGGGQPRDQGGVAGAVVVQGEHRAAVVDGHLCDAPADWQDAHARHQRGRRHRLGHQPQRLQIAAADVVDHQRCLHGVLVVEEVPGFRAARTSRARIAAHSPIRRPVQCWMRGRPGGPPPPRRPDSLPEGGVERWGAAWSRLACGQVHGPPNPGSWNLAGRPCLLGSGLSSLRTRCI
jgi:hypothetical protein